MIWFNKITPLIIVEILLVFNVHTSPSGGNNQLSKISKRDTESVISSSSIKLARPEKIENLRQMASMEDSPAKFRWSDNSSFMQDLDEMFTSIERELNEMLNLTKTKLAEGFEMSEEFFSFTFFDSDTKSEEQTEPPEAAAE